MSAPANGGALQPAVYFGLLLIAFAALSQKTPPITTSKVVVAPSAAPAITESLRETKSTPNERLQNLYHQLKEDPLLQKNLDGLSLEYLDNSILIRMSGDELFESGVYSMRESWLPTLDRFADLLRAEQQKGLLIKVHTYTDEQQPREVKSGDFGASDFTLSSLRAEWIARYFERQHNFELAQKVILIAHGGSSHGKRVDLELSFP